MDQIFKIWNTNKNTSANSILWIDFSFVDKYPQSVDCESSPDTFSTNTGTLPISSPDKASMGLPTGTSKYYILNNGSHEGRDRLYNVIII